MIIIRFSDWGGYIKTNTAGKYNPVIWTSNFKEAKRFSSIEEAKLYTEGDPKNWIDDLVYYNINPLNLL